MPCVVFDEGREGGRDGKGQQMKRGTCSELCHALRGAGCGCFRSGHKQIVRTWKERKRQRARGASRGKSSFMPCFLTLFAHITPPQPQTQSSGLFVRPAGIARMPKVSACLKGRRSERGSKKRHQTLCCYFTQPMPFLLNTSLPPHSISAFILIDWPIF